MNLPAALCAQYMEYQETWWQVGWGDLLASMRECKRALFEWFCLLRCVLNSRSTRISGGRWVGVTCLCQCGSANVLYLNDSACCVVCSIHGVPG